MYLQVLPHSLVYVRLGTSIMVEVVPVSNVILSVTPAMVLETINALPALRINLESYLVPPVPVLRDITMMDQISAPPATPHVGHAQAVAHPTASPAQIATLEVFPMEDVFVRLGTTTQEYLNVYPAIIPASVAEDQEMVAVSNVPTM